MQRIPKLVLIEEILNSITHGIGLILAIVGIIFYFTLQHTTNKVGFIIFAVSLLTLFLVSTLLHSLKFTKARKVFFILDYSAIFLFIAGSYTPFLLLISSKWYGILFLILIWMIAITGIILNAVFFDEHAKLPVLFYVIMGWLVLFIAKPLIPLLNFNIMILLFLGGILYSFGTIFFLKKTLPFAHTVWHIFVLAGSTCHFFAVFYLK